MFNRILAIIRVEALQQTSAAGWAVSVLCVYVHTQVCLATGSLLTSLSD